MTSVTIDGVESSDSPYLTITAVQKQFESTVSEVEEEEVQMPCKIDIELECAVPGCNFGGQGTNYRCMRCNSPFGETITRFFGVLI